MIESNSLENWEVVSSFLTNKDIKHLSFDFWNTIAFSNQNFKLNRAKYINNILNSKVSINSINAAFEKIGKEYNQYQESGKHVISSCRLLEMVIDELQVFNEYIDTIELKKIIDSLFLEYPPVIDLNFKEVLEAILASGKTCSLTSNTAFISGHTIKIFLDSIGLTNKFSFFLFSDEVGYAKPNNEIYEILFKNAKIYHSNLKFSQVIHIGDSIVADYYGALRLGYNSYLFNYNNNTRNHRCAVHTITNSEIIPFIPLEYSKFKFGDSSIAKKYGQELFEFFRIKHLKEFIFDTSDVIICSSPYTYIPTSSYFLTKYFLDNFNKYIEDNNIVGLNLNLIKIERQQTYTQDYGAMDAQERYDLIKNDTFFFSEKPIAKSKIIFIDDISITGTHQRVIEEILKRNSISNICIFLYYAKLGNSQISPTIENDLNYAFVNSIEEMCVLINEPTFEITTRAVKFILKSKTSKFLYFIDFLNNNRLYEFADKIHFYSIKNGYDKIEEFRANFGVLSTFILSPQSKTNY
ncbi:MAG: HAD-IA family hydrolase [Pedobacter sp.]|nr:HAD-IA family hydrolase [Pedobacter sp.]